MTDPAARRKFLGGAKRLVVKLGSSLLAPASRAERRARLRALAEQIAALRRGGRDVVLVSSGAIASGMRLLGVKRRPAGVVAQQALAGIGQPELMRAYAEAFARHRMPVAQVLVTRDDLRDPRRRRNARRALGELLRLGTVPVVNENDTVAVEEIRMGDNDLLSAYVTLLSDADALILLTDVDGLYDGHPRRSPSAARLGVVRAVSPAVRRLAGRAPGSEVGSGGMRTKIEAAGLATRAGHAVLIARGNDRRVLLRALAGEDLGTLFLPAGRRLSRRERGKIVQLHSRTRRNSS